MALSQKSISFLLLSLICLSCVCSASRSTFNEDDDMKTNAEAQVTTGTSTFNNGDDKKTNAGTQVTTSAVAYGGNNGGGVFTPSSGGYTSGNCGSSSCSNGGGGGGSMSGCASTSCSYGGGGSMSGDCSPSPCQVTTPSCQMPVHCTPQCPNVQPAQSPCSPQYPQPQTTPCNTCNQQQHCPNSDCGNGGYSGFGSTDSETDSEDPYYEKQDSETKSKKPDSDGTN